MKVIRPNDYTGTEEYGGLVKIMISDETGSNLHSGIFTLKPGEALAPDIHRESDEIFYVISGEITVESGDTGEKHLIHAGELLYIPKGETHITKNSGDVLASVHWCFAL